MTTTSKRIEEDRRPPPFSTDLFSSAVEHISFLQTMHQSGVTTLSPPTTTRSLNRYLHNWLPLIVNDPSTPTIPPPDVAWLWHCHRLAPRKYCIYLESLYGKGCGVPDANPPFAVQFKNDPKSDTAEAIITREMWSKLYPDESFFLEDNTLESSATSPSDWILSGYDLLASAKHQAGFLFQVSGPRFKDVAFLKEAVDNYHKFLLLRTQDSSLTLVPTYQIDLMWHTHILTSVTRYRDDCIAITGSPLDHDDSLNDRTPGAKLDTSYQRTSALWKQTYGTEYAIMGGMYRGEPPTEYFKDPQWIDTSKHVDKAQQEAVIMAAATPLGTSGTATDATAVVIADTWTNPYRNAPDGSPGFIAPNAKSTTMGVNANQQLDYYVFGDCPNSRGLGYYHETTREYLEIYARRVSAKISSLEFNIACLQCCCGSNNAAEIARKEAELEQLKKIQSDLTLWSGGAKPKKINNRTIANDSGTTYYAYDLGAMGGGCGACGVSGGGCGGGAAGCKSNENAFAVMFKLYGH